MRRADHKQKWHHRGYTRGFRPVGPFGSGRKISRSRDRVVMGVCKGISDYFQVPVLWVRTIFVLALLCSGLWPVIAIYIVASFLMKPLPIKPLEADGEKDSYNTSTLSRTSTISTLKSRFDSLERRIRSMEDSVTASEFEWDQKMKT